MGDRRARLIDDGCPVCEHEWWRHDPEDGKCDAYPGGDHCDGFAVVAALSRMALTERADSRVGADEGDERHGLGKLHEARQCMTEFEEAMETVIAVIATEFEE